MFNLNMKLYIQTDKNGNTIDHPMTLESAQILVGMRIDKEPQTVTEQEILANNLCLVEDTVLSIDEIVLHQEGYTKLSNGNYTRNYITKKLTQTEKVDKWVRGHRDAMLIKSDWSQLPDNDLTAEERIKWLEHRAYLRKMPEIYANVSHPDEISWPVPPLRKPLPTV